MSEETEPREQRTAQLVDEPAEPADRLAQDTDQEQVVTDRDDDGSADSVAAEAADTTIDAETADTEDTVATADDDVRVEADERDELMPGEMAAAPVGTLWNTETAGELRAHWQQLQLRFVDDPRGVVTEAQSLVGEAVQRLTTAMADQQRELDTWASGDTGETEQLRVALQRYRDFFDRILGQP